MHLVIIHLWSFLDNCLSWMSIICEALDLVVEVKCNRLIFDHSGSLVEASGHKEIVANECLRWNGIQTNIDQILDDDVASWMLVHQECLRHEDVDGGVEHVGQEAAECLADVAAGEADFGASSRELKLFRFGVENAFLIHCEGVAEGEGSIREEV